MDNDALSAVGCPTEAPSLNAKALNTMSDNPTRYIPGLGNHVIDLPEYTSQNASISRGAFDASISQSTEKVLFPLKISGTAPLEAAVQLASSLPESITGVHEDEGSLYYMAKTDAIELRLHRLHAILPLQQSGLGSQEHLFRAADPIWATEPSIDKVAALAAEELRCRGLLLPETMPSTHLEFEGAFNKLYPIASSDTSYLLRATLPVDPFFKVFSEAAILQLLRSQTSIPVPRLISYCPSPNNDVGLEWMLMERVSDAEPLELAWKEMDWKAKFYLVEAIAQVMGELLEVTGEGVGSIYHEDCGSTVPQPVLGRIVSMSFFHSGRIRYDVPRGPFTSSRDWLAARIQILLLKSQGRQLDTNADQQDRDEALDHERILLRLQKLLQSARFTQELHAFSSTEAFALHNDDLSFNNILVDQSGGLKAIVDWECTETMPLYVCCQLPGFLRDVERFDEPIASEYAYPIEENTLYHERVLEYEVTRLRAHFLDFMEANCPRWM